MSIVLVGSTSGSITLQEPAVAGSNTISLPAATGTAVLTGVSGTVDINAAGSNNVTLSTNSTERVRVDSSGNVGIGTTSPGAKLVTVGAAQVRAGDFPTTGNGLELTFTTGNTAYIQGYDRGASAWRDVVVGGNTLQFTTGGTERMRIDSSGNVGIGANTVSNIKAYVSTDTNQAGFYVRAQNASQTHGVLQVESARNTTNNTYYAIQYYNSGAGTDRFRVADSGNVTNTNGSYGTISDVKNKENIVDATPKLDKVNQLKVRNFNFKGDDLKQIGFVAQEFEQVFPSMIEEHKDTDAEGNDLGTTTKSIKTSVLVPILVKAIQELKGIVDTQATKIAELEAKLEGTA